MGSGYVDSSYMHEMVAHRFTYHPPEADQPAKYVEIRRWARGFAHELVKLCPDSDELRQALIQLDAVVFFANASIARHAACPVPGLALSVYAEVAGFEVNQPAPAGPEK